MATSTRRRNRVQAEPEFKSKSDEMRARLAAGEKVKDIAKSMGVTYGFAYGVAKRAGVAQSAASRRRTRAVTVEADGTVIVQTTAGPVRVQPDGTVIKPRSRRSAAPTD